MKSLRILFLTHENLDRTPVSRAMFADIATELRRNAAFKVIVVSAGEVAEKNSNEIKFRRSSYREISAAAVLAVIRAYTLIVPAILKSDVLLFRSYPMLIMYGWIGFLLRRKIAFDSRGLFFNELVDSGKLSKKYLGILGLLERICLFISSKIICVTESQKTYYIKKHNIDPNKFTVIPNGARLVTPVGSKCETGGSLSFCYVGSLIKWHAPYLVRDFLRGLSERGIDYTLDVITQDNTLAQEVFGEISAVKIYSHDYRNAPIRFDFGFCFIEGGISKSVCYPVKLNEYILSGTKPLVTSNVIVAREIVSSMEFGLSLDYDTPNRMVDHFIKELDYLRLQNMPREIKTLSFDYQINRYVALINSLAIRA